MFLLSRTRIRKSHKILFISFTAEKRQVIVDPAVSKLVHCLCLAFAMY